MSEGAMSTRGFKSSAAYGKKKSGWSGSSTSQEAEPHRRARQKEIMSLLYASGVKGVTAAEVRLALGVHHGVASSALTNLHKEERIARLTERRGRYLIYVALPYVKGRPTQRQGRKTPPAVPAEHVCEVDAKAENERQRFAVLRAENALVEELEAWFVKGGATSAATAVDQWFRKRSRA